MNEKEREFLIKLGQRIKSQRTAKQITQMQFAFDCGLSRSQLVLIESGETNPKFTNLMRIAEALDMTVSKLCDL